MKHLFYLALAAITAIFISCSAPQSPAANTEHSFKVWGNCEQCQATIEKAAALKGVSNISWSEESNLLKFTVDTTLASDDDVLKAVAASGYDNERYTADPAAYAGLPECCQYVRKGEEH